MQSMHEDQLLQQLFINKIVLKEMLFQQFDNQVSNLASQHSSKITYSQGTDVSEPIPLSKQISLRSCASSLSITDTVAHSQDNQIFAPFLFATDLQQQEKAFSHLKNHMQMLSDQDEQELLRFEFYQHAPEGNNERVLQHFIKNWLLFMGYGTSQNKKHYISRAKALGASDHMHKLTKIYKNPALLGWTREKTLRFLMNTCRNGWEYFIREVVAAVLANQKESTCQQ